MSVTATAVPILVVIHQHDVWIHILIVLLIVELRVVVTIIWRLIATSAVAHRYNRILSLRVHTILLSVMLIAPILLPLIAILAHSPLLGSIAIARIVGVLPIGQPLLLLIGVGGGMRNICCIILARALRGIDHHRRVAVALSLWFVLNVLQKRIRFNQF